MKMLLKKKEILNINDTVIRVWGEDYYAKLIYKNIKIIEINIKSNNIEINIPNKYKKMNSKKILEIVTKKLYDMIAEIEIESIMEKTRIMLKGLAPEDYKIERLSGRKLANFDPISRVITVNPDIVQYRKEILEYTILYEFCHLKYQRKVKGFRDMLKSYMPEYYNYEFVNACI